MSRTTSDPHRARPLRRPGVSVVVPALGRPQALRRCLAALAAQEDAPRPFEVIVVDDGSPEPLAPVGEEFAGRLDVRVHRQESAGPAAARNAGAALASGGVLLFTDDDCEPAPGWARALAAAVARRPDGLVGGRVENLLEGSRLAGASQAIVELLLAAPGSVEGRFFTSNNLGVARDTFLAAGGFDERFRGAAGEDRELCERWARLHGPLVHEPEAVVGHAHALGLGGFLRQHRGYGRGAYGLHRRRREGGGGLRPRGPAFYARLLASPFRRLPPGPAAAEAGAVALAQLAVAAGYAEEWLRSRR